MISNSSIITHFKGVLANNKINCIMNSENKNLNYLDAKRYPFFVSWGFVFVFLMGISGGAWGQFSFSDNATNYGGTWTNGSNQGTGFNAWSITTGGANAGTFIGNPSSNGMGTAGIGTTAFGLFGHSGQYVNAVRYFGASSTNIGMQIGDVFSFFWAMNWDAGGGSKGFDLRSGGTTIFNVNNGGSSTISTTNGNANTNYGTDAMLVTLTRTSWTQYSFTMTSRSGGGSYSTTINSSSSIDNINIYCGAQSDNDGNRNIYFNGFTFTKATPYEVNSDVTDPRVLSGSNALVKTGANNLNLTGANTFTGNTTINGGMLVINNDNRLGAIPGSPTSNSVTIGNGSLGVSSTLTINANRGITLNNTSSTIDAFGGTVVTYNGIIEGSGSHNLVKNGPGTLLLGGANTYTGATSITNGVLQLGATGNSTNTPLGTIAAGTTVTSGAALDLNGFTLGTAEPLTLNGSGISNNGALTNSSGTPATYAGAVSLASNTTIGGAGALTLSGVVSGASTLTKVGNNNLILSNTGNTYSGGTVHLAGTVTVSNSGNLGNASGAYTIGNGSQWAQLSIGTNNVSRNVVNIATSSTAAEFVIQPGGVFTINNLNTVSGTDNTTRFGIVGQGDLVITGSGTYVGKFRLAQGRCIVQADNGLGVNTSTSSRGVDMGLHVSGGIQNQNVSLLATNGVTIPQSIYVSANHMGGTRTIGLSGASGTATFSNEIYLDGNLTVTGTGTVVISGRLTNTFGIIASATTVTLQNSANNYTGTTQINSGSEVRLNPSANATHASQIVLNGGTLGTTNIAASRTWTSSSTIQLLQNSTIALGSNVHTITFAASNAVSWTAGRTLTITGWTGVAGISGTAGRIFIGNSASGLTSAQLDQIEFAGFGGAMLLSTGELVPANNYYSKSSGVLNTLATWGTNTDGSGRAPLNFTSSGFRFNIRNNATPTIDANWTVNGSSARIIVGDGTNACNFTVPGTFIVTATSTDVSNNGRITRTTSGLNSWGTMNVLSGGTYEHSFNGGSLPSATWNANSNLVISADVQNNSFAGANFGNVTFTGTAGTTMISNPATLSGTIQGNLTLEGTGTIIMSSAGGFDQNIVVSGNFSMTGNSTFRIESVSSSGSNTKRFRIDGNYLQSNGVMDLATNASATITANSRRSILEVRGNFTHSGGTIVENAADGNMITQILLSGTSGTQTIESTGQTTSGTQDGPGAINFNVSGSNAQCVVEAGKTFVLGSGGLTIGNGTSNPDMLVNGTYRAASSTTTTGNLSFSGTGTYEHNLGGAGAVPTATWNVNSWCKIISCGTSLPTGLGQNFGNFEWANSTQGSSNIQMSAVMTSIQGDFVVSNTGTTGALRYNANSPASPTFSVGGNVTISGGIFDLSSGSSNPVINVSGNFNQSGGTLTETGSGSGSINFNKTSGIQTLTQTTGTIANTINWNVGTGSSTNILELASNVNLGTGTGTFTVLNNATLDAKGFVLSGSNAFTSNAGSTIVTAHADGINGSITSSGTRTFNAATNYRFNGSVAQVTGALLTAANNIIIDNASHVSLSAATTLSGTVTFTNGRLKANDFALIVASTPITPSASKYVELTPTSSFRINGVSSSTLFPIGTSTTYNPLTISTGSATDYTTSLNPTLPCAASDATKIVEMTWGINGSIAPTSVTFQWSASNHASAFDVSQPLDFARANCPSWISSAVGTASGSDPYTITVSTGLLSGNQVYAFGNANSFIPPLGIQTTVAINTITNNSAKSGGQTITGTSVTGKGVVWNTSPNPTTANSSSNDGTGLSNFVSDLTSLNPQTRYYVRAYVTDGVDTEYANELDFRTLSNPATAQPTTFTASPTANVQLTATWNAATFPVSGATRAGYILIYATGTPTLSSTNGQAPAAGVGTLVNVGNTVLPSAPGTSTVISSLVAGTTYNFLLIPYTWDGTNASTYNYLTSGALTTSAVAVGTGAVTTTAASVITNSTANSGGTSINAGGGNVSAKGVVVNTVTNPTLSTNVFLSNNGTGTSNFTSNITGLAPQTLHHIRAYSTNEIGTVYGSNAQFRTLSNPPISHVSDINGTSDFTSVTLNWTAAEFPVSGASTKGYVLIRAVSPTIPTLSNANGVAPTAGSGTTIVSNFLNEDVVTFNNTGLSSGVTYNYSLIPFTWDNSNASTRHYLTASAPVFTISTRAGWSITQTNERFVIDFDNTVAGVNNGQFAGTGFQPDPTVGRLNSNAWAVTGWNDGSLAFGGTRNTASSDFTRGNSTGNVTQGGIYAFTVETGNNALGFQPGGSDWAPGTITLRFQNNSNSTISELSLGYKLWVRNDQGRASSFNFSHSGDNSNYSNVTDLNLTSTEAADASPSWLAYQRNATLSGLNIAPGAFYFLRWSGADVSGSGSRDEFALDDITLVANPSSIFADVKGTVQEFIQAGNTELSANATMNTINLISGVCDVKDKSLTINANSISRTSGQIDASDGTLVFGNSSTLTLPTSVFVGDLNNVTLSGSSVKPSNNLTVNGTLNLNAANPDAINGLLDMVVSYGNYANTRTADATDANNNLNSHVLTLGANASVTGQGDVTGKIRRTSFSDGVTYAFGNANMTLKFDQNAGTLPSQVTVVATRGDEGLHVDKNGSHNTGPNGLIGGAAVKRMYQILRTGGTSPVRFTVRFPYTDSELNGNNEANLVTWDHHIPYQGMTPHEHGKTSNDVNTNYVELANHGLFYLSEEGDSEFTKYWMLSEKVSADNLWLGAAGGGQGVNWDVASNWTNGVIPSSTNLINFVVDNSIYANELTINGSHEANAIEIKPGAIVNGGTGTLTLKGGPADNGGVGTWINNGTFNAGTSTVIFDNDEATLAGATNFHNVTINAAKKLTPQADAVMGISGTLTIDGTLDATANANEIVYNGSNQTIYQPNGTIPGYSGLGIQQNSGGVVTLGESIKVLDNLNMTEGNIDPNGHTLEIGKDVSRTGNVNWVDGTVLGSIKRWFGTSANSTQASGIFPVGLADENRLAVINFTGSTDGGYIVMEYKSGKPTVLDENDQPLADPFGLPLTYINSQGLRRYIQNADATGYWDITPYSSADVAYGALDDNTFDITLRMNSQIIQNNPVTANPPGMRIIRAKGNPIAAHDPFEIGASAAIITQVQGSTPGTDFLVRSNGLQGFSWFNIGGDNETPLPVELLYFNGQCTEEGNVLRWATASEFNSSHYDVEASRDGENWNVVNTITAAGFSAEKLNYQTVDMAKNEGTMYYRLRQVDINGDERVYNPIAVTCGLSGSLLTTYPNPSGESFTLLISDESLVGQAILNIRDINGRLVTSTKINILSGSNSYEINEALTSGIYFIQVENGTKVSSVLRQSVR